MWYDARSSIIGLIALLTPSGTPLGDPIELGAAAAVLCAGSSGSNRGSRSISLQSSKSWMGHAEPASGIVGLLHAAASLQLASDLPVMHLGRMSDHAMSAMTGGGGADGILRAPRQAAPRPRPRLDERATLGEVAGVSAFAFQVRGYT